MGRVRMKVTFHATVKEAAGISRLDVTASTIGELLLVLKSQFGENFYDLIVRDGEICDDIVLLLNGKNISRSSGFDTRLSEDDELAIFPPISGGLLSQAA